MKKYDDLFDTALEVYKFSYPKEYAESQERLKELVCDLTNMMNIDIHQEASELLLADPLFLRSLCAIVTSTKSFGVKIESYKNG